MKLKTLVSATISIFLLAGCGNTGRAINNGNGVLKPHVPPKETLDLPQKYLEYLKKEPNKEEKKMLTWINWYRKQSGLDPVVYNSKLHMSAKAHAIYSYKNNGYGHYETKGNQYYFGEAPVNRMANADYKYGYGEDISYYGEGRAAIDNLITAIYHRHPILDMDITEVGCGAYGRYNVVDFGVKPKNIHRKEYVLYPPKDGIIPLGSFWGENPNPLKGTGAYKSGVPISIDFDRTSGCDIDMDSFKLYDNHNREVDTLKVMTAENDPNEFFTPCQFALFPRNILKQEIKYRAEFKYNGDQKVAWTFRVRESRPEIKDATYYEVTKNKQIFEVKADKKYIFHISAPNIELDSDILEDSDIKVEAEYDLTVGRVSGKERYFYVEDISEFEGDKAIITIKKLNLKIGLKLVE